MNRTLYLIGFVLLSSLSVVGAIPAGNIYTAVECEGSRMPYPDSVGINIYPDSLTPVFINHVGRHGARYPTSSSKIKNVTEWLGAAEKNGSITSTGLRLLRLSRYVEQVAAGCWGDLDSVGIAEQKGIAARMYKTYPSLFNNTVVAESSYVPRCVLSMYEFCHSLTQCNERLQINAFSGSRFSDILRPFEINQKFLTYYKEKPYNGVLSDFTQADEPVTVIHRFVKSEVKLSHRKALSLIGDIYYMLASCSSMGINVDPSDFFTLEEYNQMWRVDNLRQYLARTNTTVSSIPSAIAVDLVENLINTTQDFIDGVDTIPVHLRFGHAETILPLVSLLRLPGCYYMTDNFDDVYKHWQTFNIIPMAANLQLILFKSESGRYYLRIFLNERPISIADMDSDTYIPWERAKAYMENCIQ